ncbi:hypothetical protein BRC65_02165 [Halobacteriales archaeon QH_2_65_14]|nr:MAG: hypothetical protein BRC65_02165 [Halobacteriales archaeon QH_2_65_14]
MTYNRDQTRGIVLATVMLVSAVAMAFVGGAGAASTDDVDSLASQAGPDNVTADTILGDVNENDNIGLSDAILIQEEVVGIRDPGTTFDADAADLNRDGTISLTDAILVQEKVVGILNEGEITVSNLDAPDTAQSGSEIDVSADLENLGDEGALQDIEFRIAPVGEPLDENATVATEFVDMAASGVSNPVDRPAQDTLTFENVTVNVPAGDYHHGVFSEDDSATGTITIQGANSAINGTVTDADTTNPVQGANVTVYDGDSTAPGDEVANTTTNSSGFYSVTDLESGDYTVEVEADGYGTATALVSVGVSETVTQDFALEEPDPAFFDVSVVSSNNETAAGSTQTFDVPLSVTLDATQAMDTYGVTVTSNNDTANTQARVGPERSLNQTQVAPGDTVRVTISGEVSSSSELNLADAWSPNASEQATVVSSTFTRDFTITSDTDVVIAFQEDQGTFELVYDISVPSGSDGTTYQWDFEDSALEIDGVSFPVLGDQQFEVTSNSVASMRDRSAAVAR